MKYHTISEGTYVGFNNYTVDRNVLVSSTEV